MLRCAEQKCQMMSSDRMSNVKYIAFSNKSNSNQIQQKSIALICFTNLSFQILLLSVLRQRTLNIHIIRFQRKNVKNFCGICLPSSNRQFNCFFEKKKSISVVPCRPNEKKQFLIQKKILGKNVNRHYYLIMSFGRSGNTNSNLCC